MMPLLSNLATGDYPQHLGKKWVRDTGHNLLQDRISVLATGSLTWALCIKEVNSLWQNCFLSLVFWPRVHQPCLPNRMPLTRSSTKSPLSDWAQMIHKHWWLATEIRKAEVHQTILGTGVMLINRKSYHIFPNEQSFYCQQNTFITSRILNMLGEDKNFITISCYGLDFDDSMLGTQTNDHRNVLWMNTVRKESHCLQSFMISAQEAEA